MIQEDLERVTKYYDMMIEFMVTYSVQIIAAFIIIILGVLFSKYIYKLVSKLLLKHNFDTTLSRFVANFLRSLVLIFAAILALGKLGISVAPFIAAIGALSLTAGLALQGSVSNFAAGVVLIITKPFKIGDTITVHDVYGRVEEIKLAYTLLVNEDKEEITIPNKYMIGDVLINSFAFRIVEGSIGIAYSADVNRAIALIRGVLSEHKELSQESEAIVGIESFGDSSINIAYKYWAPTQSYFKIQYDINLQIFESFQKEQIEIPFPQREIKIIGERDV